MALFRRWCDGSRRGMVVLQEVADFEERPFTCTSKPSNTDADDHRVSYLQFVAGIEESRRAEAGTSGRYARSGCSAGQPEGGSNQDREDLFAG